MSNAVTYDELETINYAIYMRKKDYTMTWNDVADLTGRSITTVKKYYDKNWFPGKYAQKEPVKDTRDFNKLEYPGVYMLTQQVIEDNKVLNLIKVGKSTNIRKRLDSYKTSNPTAKVIDTQKCHIGDIDKLEKVYHTFLSHRGKKYKNTEWFVVNDEYYEYFLSHKLDFTYLN